MRNQLRLLSEAESRAPQQQRGDGHADELLRDIEDNAESARQLQPLFLQRRGHDESSRAASGENRGPGHRHIHTHDGTAQKNDSRHRAKDAAEGNHNDLPLPFDFREVNRCAQGNNQNSRDEVSKTADLGVLNQRPGQDPAPKASQQNQRDPKHRGEDRFGFLGNELARRVNAK